MIHFKVELVPLRYSDKPPHLFDSCPDARQWLETHYAYLGPDVKVWHYSDWYSGNRMPYCIYIVGDRTRPFNHVQYANYSYNLIYGQE